MKMSIDLKTSPLFTIFNGEAYLPLYDCSNKTSQEWYATGTVQLPLGIYFIVSGYKDIFQIIYGLCLFAMASKDLLKLPCYKIMFWMGVSDMLSLSITSLATGYFAIVGAVYCTNPMTIYICGVIGSGESGSFVRNISRLMFLLTAFARIRWRCPFLHVVPLKTTRSTS
ncbi:unnamed protein product [Heligmosomoides polygyrus]|uniref:Uncharacterized protein n=1 Tax=Heligmosomoides polygyrus TaxID=6339 RepID=A0A3P7TDD7_HELPZ|nr:unnamed protein product [Heligmosomoides polygyrus]